MLRRQLVTAMLAVLLAAALGYGLVRLFALRLEHGDVYPAYSTLRTDPLGAKAYLEALDALPGTEVRRNFRPLPRLRPAQPVTLIYAGVPHEARWGDEELRVFNALIGNGSRAVFAFSPAYRPERAPEDSKKEGAKDEKTDADQKADAKKGAKKKSGKDGKGEKEERDGDPTVPFSEAAKRWGFEFATIERKEGKTLPKAATLADPASGLEPEIAWHSGLYFDKLQPPWRTLYRHGERAVVIERRWGDGSLLLVADSYLLSNEALGGADRRPRLLAALAGPHRMIVFDEEHHGVTEQSGIVDLAKKYRLHGLAAGLLLVAALFVWKNTVRFLPPYEAEDTSDNTVTGREAAAGFTNLLRRTIPRGRLLETCVAEWRKAFAHQGRELAKVEAAYATHSALPPRDRDPLSGYRHIARALAAGRPGRSRPAVISSSPAEPPAS
jgi:hypothetical protein